MNTTTPPPSHPALPARSRPGLAGMFLLALLTLSSAGAGELLRLPDVRDQGILTPPAPREPRLQGPRVTGVRPGSPFVFRICATGERPMTYAAQGLPPGLQLSPSGILTGRVEQAGSYRIELEVRNAKGARRGTLRLEVGPTLALTPPMGWNSWYIHYDRVTDRIMREAADQMIATGMADYGYQYVNIDDCWMMKPGSNHPDLSGAPRDAEGRMQPNRRFPDMRAMTDYIHARGLRAGLYSSPGPTTCAGYTGSYGHEALDARTFAEWGFDFLKYDWCSYTEKAGGKELEHLKRPYQVMWQELQRQERDLVHNLCQYGMGDVWTWGAEVGHSWRTTGDLGLERGTALPGFYAIGLSNARHADNARPGAWNDPDYLLLGWVGDAHRMGEGTRTTLTAPEQYSYMSLWSLMAAPLVFSGDMGRLDAFTLNVLCNHEVIDINQDLLGRQARILRQSKEEVVLVKELEDGGRAVGLFNLADGYATLRLNWADLGAGGPRRVRDLWTQKDHGSATEGVEAAVSPHGVRLLRLSAP